MTAEVREKIEGSPDVQVEVGYTGTLVYLELSDGVETVAGYVDVDQARRVSAALFRYAECASREESDAFGLKMCPICKVPGSLRDRLHAHFCPGSPPLVPLPTPSVGVEDAGDDCTPVSLVDSVTIDEGKWGFRTLYLMSDGSVTWWEPT